ncbi:hypothetical protein [Winogradskyella ursingii]|uniref:hypothetical protein n=1 Tax=Winogradskyella ursingii TaxID=2686079 RepID=UPI0015C7AB0B|nr:hypothetical protein [Winogradskyella ursingii]
MRIFKEEQRFTQLWLIMLILISMLVPVGIVLGTYFKNPNSFSVLELTIILLVVLLASSIIFLFKLNTRIDEKGVHYQFFPFHLKYKVISWADIKEAHVRNYDPIGEYGGWGIRGGILWNKSKGKAINVSGDIGIQLKLKNGKKLLIGTQQKAEAESVLNTYQAKINN